MLLTEEIVAELALRICGLVFLVQVAPLVVWTELVTLTFLLAKASPKATED